MSQNWGTHVGRPSLITGMETLFADIRQGLRMMRNNVAFTVVAVSALALGIGANTGIFSVVNKVMLEPLPYPQPDRLMRLSRHWPDGEGTSVSIAKYMVWRHNDVFAAMTLYDNGGPGMKLGGDRPEQVKGLHVSADYFKVFGFAPVMGRGFTSAEDAPHGPQAAVISYGLWQARFGSDPKVLGKTLVLNGTPYPVVGVMPKNYIPDPPADVWIPMQADPNSTDQAHYLLVAGRLKDGVTLEQARGQMKLVGEQFRRMYPKWMDPHESLGVMPMQQSMVRDFRMALFILLGAVALVLLIACANVANLLLARAAARQRELAIRTAIGASRWRIVRQLLTESVMLSALGGIFGFALGAWGVRSLLLLVPGNIPRLTDPDRAPSLLTILDWRIALFTLGISFATGILFGVFPALQISKPDLAAALKEASGRTGTGRGQNRVRKFLVAAEVALALVLLASAALLIKTFAGLSAVNPGIDPRHVLTMQTSLAGYNTTQKASMLVTQSIRRIESVPGVEAAAVALALPTQNEIDLPFNIAGRAPTRGNMGDYNGDEQYRFVSPHYFQVFKIPLVRGRLFDERDVENSAKVVLINRALAKKYFQKQDPIGQVLIIGKGLGPQFEDPPRQIIGIVGDVHEAGLSEKELSAIYVPQTQVPDGLTMLGSNTIPLSWCVRSNLDAMTLRRAVEKEIQAVDGQLPLAKVQTMEQILATGTARENFNMLLLSIFAGIALLLAAIGIYGVMSYSVEQQTQEVGIRMALGANPGQVMGLMVREGMTPALGGVIAGVAIALGVTRLMASLLFGVNPTDPPSLALVSIVLAVVGLLATVVPARRAMAIDPAIALRQE